MRAIELKFTEDYEYPEDVDQIVQSFKNAGLVCTRRQAYLMWESYSDGICAGWMILPSNDDAIIRSCEPYFRVVEDY